MTGRWRRAWEFVCGHSLLLVAGTIAALVWANAAPSSYMRFSHRAEFLVNDVGMVFFFALAAKEILESMLPGGALDSPRHAALPLLAAAGGMLVPGLFYASQAAALGRPDLARGWAIPCATDIAFSYLTARFIFPRRHPAIPFLLLLAIADDAFGLVILALLYPTGSVSILNCAALMLPALGIAWWLRRREMRSFWPYVIAAGSCSWAALYAGGFHPALALVPVIPFMPHAPRDLGVLDEREKALHDTLNRFERWWETPVQVVLLFFGLVNAGVPLGSLGAPTFMVVSSLAIGKPLGVVLLCGLGVAAGLRLPASVRLRELAVLGVTAGIGFTVALFFATAAFPHGGVILDEAKMGALLSFALAPIAIVLGRALGLRPQTSDND